MPPYNEGAKKAVETTLAQIDIICVHLWTKLQTGPKILIKSVRFARLLQFALNYDMLK